MFVESFLTFSKGDSRAPGKSSTHLGSPLVTFKQPKQVQQSQLLYAW